jgi:hypothetical protein
MGFGQRWRDLISIILASSSSRILLNGTLGKAFSHRRGLRQGDLLSPMLFILAMDRCKSSLRVQLSITSYRLCSPGLQESEPASMLMTQLSL